MCCSLFVVRPTDSARHKNINFYSNVNECSYFFFFCVIANKLSRICTDPLKSVENSWIMVKITVCRWLCLTFFRCCDKCTESVLLMRKRILHRRCNVMEDSFESFVNNFCPILTGPIQKILGQVCVFSCWWSSVKNMRKCSEKMYKNHQTSPH